MPFCPKCKTEYVEGILTCADCGEKLVRKLPDEYECEICGKTVTEDDKYCKYCGANFEENLNCTNHPDHEAAFVCLVCKKPLCDECVVDVDGKRYCHEHANYEMQEEEWVAVYETGLDWEAELIKDYFEKKHIPCVILSKKDQVRGVTIGELAIILLMVPADYALRAEHILVDMGKKKRKTLYCPKCKSEYTESVKTCVDCGIKLMETEPGDFECDNCGVAVTGEDEYCRHCGANFDEELKCESHPHKMATFRCLICHKPLCDICIHHSSGKPLCAEHSGFKFYNENWVVILQPETIEEGDYKKRLLDEADIPNFLFSHDQRSYQKDDEELSDLLIVVPAEYVLDAEKVLVGDKVREEGQETN